MRFLEITVTLFILAYAAGLLTIASPCIFPILPIILARADEPFRRSGLPLLIGLTLTFAVAASLASVAGNWAIEANRYGRSIALIVMTLFGLALLLPTLATRLMAPLVLFGVKLTNWAGAKDANAHRTPLSSLLLGIATGLVWAPCAGPVLGLILTGAALHGPGIDTVLLLLAYGLGAATSLAAGMLLGGRLLAKARELMPWSGGVRRALGGAVVFGAIAIWAGLDTRLLTQLSLPSTTAFESKLIDTLQLAPSAQAGTSMGNATARTTLAGPLASIVGSRQWLNTSPLKAEDLQGKVVLVNFWTYSCINCLRVLPHVRAWANKYRDQGLVVIGVHTPEFAFEKNVGNVSTATTKLGVGYPVAIDNDFRVWRAFSNNAWPALYFVGADGRIRHQAIGEGNYATSEQVIQQLLAEAGHKPTVQAATVQAEGTQVAADEEQPRSSETYLGYAQATGFTSPGGAREDVPSLYRGIDMLPLNRWTLGGTWTIGREYAQLDDTSGRIAYRFHARDLHLVLGPTRDGKPVRFRVTIDGAAPGTSHGTDTDADGYGTVTDAKLYQLVRQAGGITDRTFGIEFLDPGVRAYAFTFG
jgi:cytochrome c biogenesis protein CcdA/thiol-disulfide isomerase/thioredoxin